MTTIRIMRGRTGFDLWIYEGRSDDNRYVGYCMDAAETVKFVLQEILHVQNKIKEAKAVNRNTAYQALVRWS